MQQQQKYFSQVNEIFQQGEEILVIDIVKKVLQEKLSQNEIQQRLNMLQENGEDNGSESNVFESKRLGEKVVQETDVRWISEVVRKVEEMKQNIVKSPYKQANNLPSSPADHTSKSSNQIQPLNSPSIPNHKHFPNQQKLLRQSQQDRQKNNLYPQQQQQNEFVNNNNDDNKEQEQQQQHQHEQQKQLQQYHHEEFDQYRDDVGQKQMEQQRQGNVQKKKVLDEKRQMGNVKTQQHEKKHAPSPMKVQNNIKSNNMKSTLTNKHNQNSESSHLTAKLTRFLVLAYHQYVLQQHSSSNNIFNKQTIFKQPLMQLTLFLKFYKDFDLKQVLKVNEVIKMFKKLAVNHLWIDVGLFVELGLGIVEVKIGKGDKGVGKVQSREEIGERMRMVMELFDTAMKGKNVLKVVPKQTWDNIMLKYEQRNVSEKTVDQDITNKTEVVDKFLQRNFALQVPKWMGKKQNLQSKSRVKPQLTPTRDYKSISSSIKQLRSKSERNLTKLKSMLDDNFNTDLKMLINKKSDQKSAELTERKVPLHKNKKQNTISVYKEIQQYLIDNSKMKVERSFLNKELRIMQDQPYLNAYFSNELKAGKEKTINENIKEKIKRKVKPSQIKNPQRQLNNSPVAKPLPILQHQRKSPPKQLQHRTPSINSRVQQAFTPLQSSSIRKKGSLSQPQIHSVQKVKPSQIYSMKKFMSPSGNKNNDNANNKNSIQKNDAKSIVQANNNQKKNGNKSKSKLSEIEKQLVNRKLQELLIKSKQGGINSPFNNNEPIKQKNSPSNTKANPVTTKSSTQPYQKQLQSISPIPQNKLMQQFRPEVYQLFKGFEKRGRQQEEIVVQENEKRKGYLKQGDVRVK